MHLLRRLIIWRPLQNTNSRNCHIKSMNIGKWTAFFEEPQKDILCMCLLSCIWTSSKSNNEKLGECLSSLGWSRIQVRTGSFISKKVITRSFTSLFNLSTINHYTVALWTFSQRPPVPFVHRTTGRGHHCELTSEFLIRSLHSARHNPPPCFLLDGVPIGMTSKF